MLLSDWLIEVSSKMYERYDDSLFLRSVSSHSINCSHYAVWSKLANTGKTLASSS